MRSAKAARTESVAFSNNVRSWARAGAGVAMPSTHSSNSSGTPQLAIGSGSGLRTAASVAVAGCLLAAIGYWDE